jgi:hypothetical protein
MRLDRVQRLKVLYKKRKLTQLTGQPEASEPLRGRWLFFGQNFANRYPNIAFHSAWRLKLKEIFDVTLV